MNKQIKQKDVDDFTCLPAGYGHYRVTAHSPFDERIDGFTFVTSFMIAIDNYKSDDAKRQREGFKQLFRELEQKVNT